MTSSFDLADALERLTSSASEFEIPNERDVSREEAEQLLEAAVEAVAESSDSITDPQVFDLYCSLLKHSEFVPGSVMNKLLDSITSGLSTQLDSARKDIQNEDQQVYRTHKAPLEMYAFLLQWFVQAAEKVKGTAEPSTPVPKSRRGRGAKSMGARAPARTKKSEEWTWFDHVAVTLGLIARLLAQLNTQRLWTTNTEREVFISCVTRPAYQVAESEVFMKSLEVRQNFYKVICRAVKNQNHAATAQILLMQRLQYHEHLAEPIAECLTLLAKEYDHTQLGDEIIREISQKEFNAQDNKAPRIYGRLLTKFAEDSPRALLKQLSLLLAQLESDAYPMRMAVIESMGLIILDLAAALDGGTAEDPHQFEKQIKGIYDFLLERVYDSNSYVRVKVLAVLTRLSRIKRKFPKQRLKVTKEAVGALEDKTPTVRKNAITLLIELLHTHPYWMVDGGRLSLDVFNEGYAKLKKELDEIEHTAHQRVMEATNEEEDEEGETTKKPKKKKRTEDDMEVDDEDEEPTDDEDENEDEGENTSMAVDEEGQLPSSTKKNKLKPRKSQLNLEAFNDDEAIRKLTSVDTEKLRLQKKYFADGLEFIRQMEGAIVLLVQMLGSKSKAEVLEAMEFFRVAHEYQLSTAETGIRKMLHLIWNKDNNATSEDGKQLKGVRARLLECYQELYFNPVPDISPKEQVNRIAKNMIQLTFDATLADLTSLEEMMRTMMEDDRVHQDVINKLWNIFSVEKHIPKYQRRGAIIILGMLALSKRSVLVDKVDVMLKVGLGALGKADLTLARFTCVALQRLAGTMKKVKGTMPQTKRIEMDSPIFRKMRDVIERPCRSKDWFGLAEQAINTIYALGQQPDDLCSDIIKKMTIRIFTPKTQAEIPQKDLDAMDEDENPSQANGNPSQTDEDKGDAFELAQLLFVVGHVAIKQIAYLEVVEREMKKQKESQKSAGSTSNGPQATDKDGEELDQVTGNTEDEIGDKITEIREHEMLDKDSLLGVYGPMLVNICGSPQKFKNPTLRAAATLSLSKFLCVSSTFCEQHHRLLFKILETSKNAGIRSNIVIALGDVAVSFSSIIDENSNELYKGLSDRDPIVKKNTLMVLTHLILNGMVKVKGQLGEMAKCVEDEEDLRISDLAKLFFQELSTKDNAIYNNLPDVISHLSAGDNAVDEVKFQKTLKFIFGFIEKEKQAENIVEKLCQRFRLTDDPRQWRDIAYCLSLLPYKSEKSVKKIVEGLPFYRDKLYEEGVFEKFQEILQKARLTKSKNDIGAELKEFEEILDEARRQGQDDQALEKRAKGKKAQAKKRAKKNARRVPAKATQDRSESEEE
ncbi:non-SMC mitotic condensation complex subunit 1-domain-containing protein [Lentinula edodes]|uniref:non-SMC mitotic condensation complex subunit 1-domain-containing protein n=1 Tax=Lentinula edodes TaxID=5353 RepID=UPI001E8E4AF5|nr:non-SMC mitotic condensation complex subunit 1-domain-containing protein [Lentinula edodes]KAH7878618.1 non-SMC mitotic condensation complex subunit 1-domain-containing protein [Lentinula edodes]